MSPGPPRWALVLYALALPAWAVAEEAPRRRVAVLEFRGGVDRAPDLADAIAARLKATASLALVDLREARRRNPGIDGEVARCSSDPGCTAAAGGKLAVDEVLLVALSQLGDLVVNLQRIDVSVGATLATPISAVLPGGAAGEDEIDGWMRQLYPPDVFKRWGRIAIDANVDGAVITVNGKVYGETPLDGALRIPAPHEYRVNLSKPGHLGFSARIEVVPDATVAVHAELQPLPKAPPWYKRWYPWVIAGGIVAGGAVGAGILFTSDWWNMGQLLVDSPPHMK